MFFKIQKKWGRVACLGLLLGTLALQANSLPTKPVHHACNCNGPSNGVKTSQASGSASFSWSAVTGATGYEVWYVRLDDNYSSDRSTVTSTSIGYTGLTAGRHVFYIKTRCGEGASDYVILEDVLII